MNLYEKIQRLCDIRGISVNRLEREAGIGRGSIAKWANSVPSAQKIAAVADVLEVPIEHLLAGVSDGKSKVIKESSTSLDDVAVRLLVAKEERKKLLNDVENSCLDLFRKLSDEDKAQILRIMKLYVDENRRQQKDEE